MDIIERIEALFVAHGEQSYEGARRERICATVHALQCAQLAEWAGADAALVAAALLHDVGHFLAAEAIARNDRLDDRHEDLAVPLLAGHFGPELIEPIRLHVQAKRCLVTLDAGYAATLSPASVHSLALQGGPMGIEEAAAFQALPHAQAALSLRRWDDLAKVPGRDTPPLGYYLGWLDGLRVRTGHA